MIRRLVLRRFGRFRDASYELAPVTVFLGANESGKTTVADALFAAIAGLRGTQKEVRELKARYGADAAASAEPESAVAALREVARDPTVWFRVFAVRSGTLDVEWKRKDAREWLSAILFSGAADLAAIADALRREANPKGNRKDVMEQRRREEALRELEHRIEERKNERERILAAHRERDALARRIAEKTARRDRLRAEEERLRGELEKARTRRDYDRLAADYRFLRERDAIERDLEGTAPYAGDRSADLRRASEALAGAEHRLAAAERERAIRREELERLRREEVERPARPPAPALPAVLAAVLVIVAAGAFLAGKMPLALSFLVAGFLAGGFAWRRHLARARYDHETAAHAARRRDAEAALAAAEEALRRAERDLAGARRSRDELLRSLGARDEADYAACRERRRSVEKRAAEWRAKYEKRFGSRPVAETEADLRRRLDTLEEKGVPDQSYAWDEARFRSAEAERERYVAEIRTLEEEIARLEKEKAAGEGEAAGALGRIDDELVRDEREAERLRRAIADFDEDRRAYELAEAAVREIAADTARRFEALAAEVAVRYGTVAPPATGPAPRPARRVAISDLDDARAEDAAGELRPVEALSSGTSAAFYLAARLALAARAMAGGPGLLVLDEPFAHLDAARTKRAAETLRAFRDETGAQLVVLLKDEGDLAALRAAFPGDEVLVHRLAA